METILVTERTGFLAGWSIRKLLEQGYRVKATVRSEDKVPNVISMLECKDVSTKNLSFAFVDLTKANGWDKAMDGIDKVLHHLAAIITKIQN